MEKETLGGASKKNKAAKSSPTPSKVAPNKKARVPMHTQVTQSIPKEAQDPKYEFRYCADYNKGKIERYLAAGWEFVTDGTGAKIRRPGGETLHLMKIPKEFAEEDRLAKKGKIIDTNAKFKADHQPDTEGDAPEYLVEKQNLL